MSHHERRLLHLSIDTNAGSCEHYYHFVFGYLLPLGAYLAKRKVATDQVILLRSCGPLDRILHELDLPGLLLCERSTHAGIEEILLRRSCCELDKIKGFDFGELPEHQIVYDAEGIDAGITFVRRRLTSAVISAVSKIEATWTGRPRVLLIERGNADPFYQSPLAELKTSGDQRRSIQNHSDLAAALASTYAGFRNVILEATPLAEQIALFNVSDILVAQHGAALSNIIWMRRGTKVIEIDPDMGSVLFSRLAQVFDLFYARVRQHGGPFGSVSVREIAALITS